MRMVIYNQDMLDVAKEDLQSLFEKEGIINLSYEKASKPRTLKQEGFIFAALINGIADYFRDCGFNVDNDDVRYKLYEEVAEIVPEMVVDKQIFDNKPRIKHIGEMDRELCSKFIDGIFTVIDTKPLYSGLMLHPSVYFNYLFHLDPEEIKLAQKTDLPERDEEYLSYIHNQPCMVCGIQHRSHAHHCKLLNYITNSKKTPDWTAISLCQEHHLHGAHQQGHNWLVESLKWLPVDLETFCRINYIRWKNKKN